MTDINQYLQESEKATFPGHPKKKHNEIERELEKTEHYRQKARQREEKRKCSLPPFLMVRAGLLNSLLPTLISGACLTTALINNNYQKFPRGDILISGFFIITTLCFVFDQERTRRYMNSMREDISTISYQLNEFISNKDKDATLDLDTSTARFPKLITIMARHFVKNNPGLFDKIIANPSSVQDMDVAENIILGYLKKHPDAAQLILDTFNETTMPAKVYKKATLYSNRLKGHKKSK
ncbi:MAG: hypothetical protein J5613_01825 [Alphaproteobacteria bacterium]|nr:hypothetical protein [Alphaproteobacteria bacterium]